MNERPYLVLWFVLAFFGVLVVAAVYQHWTAPAPATQPTTQPATRSRVERLRDERERRMRDRMPATTTSPATRITE